MSAQLRLVDRLREQANKVVSLLPSQRRFSKVRPRPSRAIGVPETVSAAVAKPSSQKTIKKTSHVTFDLDGEQIYQLSELRRHSCYYSARIALLLVKHKRTSTDDKKLSRFVANRLQTVGLFSKILKMGGLGPQDCTLLPIKIKKRPPPSILATARLSMFAKKPAVVPDTFDNSFALNAVGLQVDSGALAEKFRFRVNKQQVEDSFLLEELVNMQMGMLVDLAAFAIENNRDKLFTRATVAFGLFEQAEAVEPWFQRAVMKMNLLRAKVFLRNEEYDKARGLYIKNLELWGSIVSYFSNPKLGFMRRSIKVHKAHYLLMASACGLFQLGFQTGDANQARVALSIMKTLNEYFAKDRTVSLITNEYGNAYAKRLEKIDQERQEFVEIIKATAPHVFGQETIDSWVQESEETEFLEVQDARAATLDQLHVRRVQSAAGKTTHLSRRKTSVDMSDETVIYKPARRMGRIPSGRAPADEFEEILNLESANLRREAASKSPLVIKIAKGIESLLLGSRSTAPNDSVADRSSDLNQTFVMTAKSTPESQIQPEKSQEWRKPKPSGLPLGKHPSIHIATVLKQREGLDTAMKHQVLSTLEEQRCEDIDTVFKKCKTLGHFTDRTEGSIARNIKLRCTRPDSAQMESLAITTPDELRIGYPDHSIKVARAVQNSRKVTTTRKLKPAKQFFTSIEWEPAPKKELRSLILDHATVEADNLRI